MSAVYPLWDLISPRLMVRLFLSVVVVTNQIYAEVCGK